MKVKELVSEPQIICVVGDVNSAKSNLLYHVIEEFKREGNFNLYTYGLKNRIKYATEIFSVNELEQIRNSIIIIDELNSLWDLEERRNKKMIEKTLRLIHHNNNVLIICALPENLKKFICGKINKYFFKQCTISDFINGSKAKAVCTDYKGIEAGTNILSLKKGEAIYFNGIHYSKMKVPYLSRYDTKKGNPNILTRIQKKNVLKSVKKNVQENVQEKVKISGFT